MSDIVPIEPTRPTEVSLPGNTDKAKEGASPEKKVIAKAKVQKKSAIKETVYPTTFRLGTAPLSIDSRLPVIAPLPPF